MSLTLPWVGSGTGPWLLRERAERALNAGGEIGQPFSLGGSLRHHTCHTDTGRALAVDLALLRPIPRASQLAELHPGAGYLAALVVEALPSEAASTGS